MSVEWYVAPTEFQGVVISVVISGSDAMEGYFTLYCEVGEERGRGREERGREGRIRELRGKGGGGGEQRRGS